MEFLLANQNDLAFSSFAGFGLVSRWVHIGLYFHSWESEQVVYGKWTKKEADVISYFLMINEWHPCFIF